MNSDHGVFPDHYTFSQRNGYAPLPEAMNPEVLSADLRRELCNALHYLIKHLLSVRSSATFTVVGIELFRSTLGEFQGIPDHTVDVRASRVQETVDNILILEPFHRVLSFLEILLRYLPKGRRFGTRPELAKQISTLLQKHGAVYRLGSIDPNGPRWFHPCESEEHAKAISDALEKLHRGGFEGATQHLRNAAGHIDGGRHGNAITECIHAVESVARKIDPKANKTLTPALKSLRARRLLTHDALRKSFEILYGYTNDEQGLRHAMIDTDEAAVGVDESVFMFGACASFAGYLARKHLAGNDESS